MACLLLVPVFIDEAIFPTYGEGVGHGRVGRQRALGDHTGAVHPVGADLIDTVEVNTGRLVAKLVGQVDDDGITNVGLDLGARPLSVDTNDRPRDVLSTVGVDPGSLPVVGDRSSQGNVGKSQCEQRSNHDGRS